MADLRGRTVLLGISGGIASYKSVELARLLVKAGASVKTVMTASGQKFVSPLTFRTVTGNPVATTLWSDPASPFPHISLSDEADLIVVAPATANIIAKYARGIADDLLSTTLLAASGKVAVAPAMNTRMYLHPAMQENLGILKGRGVMVIEPQSGLLACGQEGVGRMAEAPEIFEVIAGELTATAALAGRTVVVTAGPTREYIDPVRFISNPSTGLMGYLVAGCAARRGASVVLISGPCSLACPAGVEIERVVSAEEMGRAVMEHLPEADILVMSAAVADFRPTVTGTSKAKKRNGVPELTLEATTDILTEVMGARGDTVVVGFAAETDDVIENAREKLKRKGLDLIVANKVDEPDSGFASDTNRAAVISSPDEDVELGMKTKGELADIILDRAGELL